MKRMLAGLLLLLMLAGLAGCGREASKALTPKQAAAVKQFQSLPKSAQDALMARNLVGCRVFSEGKNPMESMALEVLIRNGAERASNKDADFVVTSENPDSLGGLTMVVSDKMGNRIAFNVGPDTVNLETQRVADTLGTERKAGTIAEAEGNKRFEEVHRRVLGIKNMNVGAKK